MTDKYGLKNIGLVFFI